MKKLFAFLFLGVMAFSLIQQNVFAQQEPQKYALVIGNGNYTGISKLSNPVNDANDMEAALRTLGFTVDKVLDGNLERMENAVVNLQRRLSASRNAYGFFYYAGHGVQSNGENYLIPIDASNIQTENHLRQRAVSVQTLMDNLGDAGNVGASSGSHRVYRGGSWNNSVANVRSAYRGLNAPSYRNFDLGFRVVRDGQ